MSISPKTTNRKFYKKWLYKVTLTIPGAILIKIYKRDQLLEFFSKPSPATNVYSAWKQKAWRARHDIKDLFLLLDGYDSTEWAQRVEADWIDLYTNNKDLYDKLSDKFETLVVHRFEPDPETIDKLNDSNGKTMIVKKLPKGRFNYRVYLLPHKMTDIDERIRFLEWLDSQKPRVTCTDSIKKWFMKTKSNWDRRYILIEDEGTLLMLKLKSSEVVGSVYKFEVA